VTPLHPVLARDRVRYDARALAADPEFQSKLSAYPASTVASPHLFKKVAVPGICVAD